MAFEILKQPDLSQFNFTSRGAPKKRNYPWRTLEVGDAFLVEGEAKYLDCVQRQASARGKEFGKRFATRKTDKGLLIIRES